jgi:hypothetical protein
VYPQVSALPRRAPRVAQRQVAVRHQRPIAGQPELAAVGVAAHREVESVAVEHLERAPVRRVNEPEAQRDRLGRRRPVDARRFVVEHVRVAEAGDVDRPGDRIDRRPPVLEHLHAGVLEPLDEPAGVELLAVDLLAAAHEVPHRGPHRGPPVVVRAEHLHDRRAPREVGVQLDDRVDRVGMLERVAGRDDEVGRRAEAAPDEVEAVLLAGDPVQVGDVQDPQRPGRFRPQHRQRVVPQHVPAPFDPRRVADRADPDGRRGGERPPAVAPDRKRAEPKPGCADRRHRPGDGAEIPWTIVLSHSSLSCWAGVRAAAASQGAAAGRARDR